MRISNLLFVAFSVALGLVAGRSSALAGSQEEGGSAAGGHDDSLRALKAALESSDRQAAERDLEGSRKTLQDAFNSVLKLIGEESDAGSPLARSLKEASEAKSARDAAKALRAGAEEALFALSFKPLVESPIPEGFPSYTPVGQIEVKRYPVVRSARAAAGASLPGGRSVLFMQLFRHIQRNEISMTAPVVMDYRYEGGREGEAREDAQGKIAMDSMAFLYRSTGVGKTGREGTVEVQDLEPMTAVSIGLRGEYTQERFLKGLERLETWLEKNRHLYERDGEPRVLAYNSPMVPGARKYAEVQIPVRHVETAGKSERTSSASQEAAREF